MELETSHNAKCPTEKRSFQKKKGKKRDAKGTLVQLTWSNGNLGSVYVVHLSALR
jgi:hypothetical protein